MTTTEPNTDEVEFVAPGPGSWMLDTTHHGSRPTTRFMWPLYKCAFEDGMSQMMKRYGLPLSGGIMGDVHGLSYVRMLAIGEKESSSGKPPPAFVLKLLSRLHPELRRRNRVAAAALQDRAWRRDVAWWFEEQRPRVVEGNLKLQAVDVSTLSDDELVRHIDSLTENFTTVAIAGFANHGGDIIPVGLFLRACAGWGIDAADAATALSGASPATLENHHLLAPVAAAIGGAAQRPESIDDIRSLGEPVSLIVDEWLMLHGWRLLTSDDIDAQTLSESPSLQLRSLLAAVAERPSTEAPDVGPLRARVPTEQQSEFDDLLAEARYGLTQRDDGVGVAWNWPAGLIRRALLEVGRRLVDRGRALDPQHAVELDQQELRGALSGAGPGADDLAARRRFRDAIEQANPPGNLGPEGGPPPLDLFPTPLATMAGAVLAVIDAMEHTEPGIDLIGTGIGTDIYRGRACVVQSPVDALDHLEQGDVLVVPFTSPSYNSVFPMVGAMVTDHGGPMSHTAIMAREFGVSAVVGTGHATSLITHGSIVEVDPASSSVRVVG